MTPGSIIHRKTDRAGHRPLRQPGRRWRSVAHRLGRRVAALAALSQILLVLLHLPFAVPTSGSGEPPLYLSLCTAYAQSSLDPSSETPAGGKGRTGTCSLCLLAHNAGFFPAVITVSPPSPGHASRLAIAIAPSPAAVGVAWPRPSARAPPA